jgi:hypothetical protein
MRLRLTRKLAHVINGVDLSRTEVGGIIDLPRREADMLLAEGWAEPEAPLPNPPEFKPHFENPAFAADSARKRRKRKRT